MRPSSSSRRTALVVSAIGSGYLIRITARDSHSVLSLSARNSTALTAPVPISSCCSHRGAAFIGAASELGGAERAGVDRCGVDVDGDVAVVLLDDLAQFAHRRFVLGDAAGEGELVGHAARAR